MGWQAERSMRYPRLKTEASGWHHCYSRTNGPLRDFPLDSPASHGKLLELIRYYVLGYSCEACGFSIMGNHYHLMVRFEAFRRLSQEELEEGARYFYPKTGASGPLDPASLEAL